MNFFVVPSLSHDVVLGDDALPVLNASISYEQNTVHLAGKRHVSNQVEDGCVDFAEVRLDIDKWVTEFPELFDYGNRGVTKTGSIEIHIAGFPRCRDFGKKSGIIICDSRPGNSQEFHLFCLEFAKMRASEFFLKLKR